MKTDPTPQHFEFSTYKTLLLTCSSKSISETEGTSQQCDPNGLSATYVLVSPYFQPKIGMVLQPMESIVLILISPSHHWQCGTRTLVYHITLDRCSFPSPRERRECASHHYHIPTTQVEEIAYVGCSISSWMPFRQ